MKKCKYCGKETSGMAYCDKTCKEMKVGLSVKQLLENVDNLNENDKFWLVKVPLKMYNKFYNRNVVEETFVTMLKKISAKMIPFEYKFAVAYYNAARVSHETFMELSELKNALVSKEDYNLIKSHVYYNFSRKSSRKAEYHAQFDFMIEKVTKHLEMNSNFEKMLADARKTTSIDSFTKKTTKYANAAVFVLLNVIKTRIRQDEYSRLSNTSPITIRRISKKITDAMENARHEQPQEAALKSGVT